MRLIAPNSMASTSASKAGRSASVNMRPIDEYAPLKKKVAFSQLVAAGVAKNESVIGYRVAADAQSSGAQGVVLNPAKGTEFTPAAGDSLIVVGNV